MGFFTRETAALQSTHPTQKVKLIIRYYLLHWLTHNIQLKTECQIFLQFLKRTPYSITESQYK